MWLLLLSVLLLATTVLGQDEPIQLYGFRGLNTIAGDFQLKPVDARKAHDVDFGRQIGCLMPRRGYDSISAMPNADSIVGIYGAYYSDGSQQMFSVIDRDLSVDTTLINPDTFGNETGTGATSVSLPDTDEFGHFDINYIGSWNADIPRCKVTRVEVYCKNNTGYSGCTMRMAIYDASDAAPANWTVEAESPAFDLPKDGGWMWRGVDCNIFVDSGKKALAIITYDGEQYSMSIGYTAKANGGNFVFTPSAGTFKSPLGTADLGTDNWCIKALYSEYTMDTSYYDYGTIYVTPKGSADISASTNLWEHFSVQNKPSFAMLDDNIYMVNGSHKGVVYDGNTARPYPLQSPGEPYIVPLSTSGPLHGEYRYVIRGIKYSGGSGTSILNTVVSSPVLVKNGQILLTRLQLPIADSVYDSIDSGYFRFYRTKADPGRLDLSDTAYRVPDSLGWDAGDISDLVFIDSISDENLGVKLLLVDVSRRGRDSLGAIVHCYGSPTFVSSDTTHPDSDTLLDIFEGWPTIQTDTLGVAYTCTFIDTATGIESDTGRSLFVFCDSGNASPSFRQVTINLPKTIDTEDGIVVNLYRACILELGYHVTLSDTIIWKQWSIIDRLRNWIDRVRPDTVVVGDYYLIGQYTSDDTIITDNISYDSLSRCRRYTKTTAPPLMSKIFSYGNRLFGIQKSGLYYSASVYADTLQSWGAMALTPINPDDGDMVTTAWPARGVIRVMKSYSNVNVYQDANLNWDKTEISGYVGCIAGRSHIAGLGGHYYLSSKGVIRETEGMSLERTHRDTLLSSPLNNFRQYNAIEMSEAEGFYFDDKYLLCIGDTTYVYDERAGAWSTWGFDFSSATLYGTEDEVRFLPGDSMYFIKSGSPSLYRFAGSDSDMTTPIEMVWKSGPFLAGPEEKRIYRVGRWISGTDAAGSVGLNVLDEEGDSLGSITFSSLTSRYLMRGFGLGPANLFQVEITSSSPGTAIEKIDIWYKVLARKITQ